MPQSTLLRRHRSFLASFLVLISVWRSILLHYDKELLDYSRELKNHVVLARRGDDFPAKPQSASVTRSRVHLQKSRSSETTHEERPVLIDKPYLVLHVGPPKTATTSLQTDLTRMNSTLTLDNYIYAGRYYDPAFNPVLKKMVPNRKDTDLGGIARSMFQPSHCPRTKGETNLTSCVEGFRQALEAYRGHNVLLSDEAYSATFHLPKYYTALKDAIGDEWEVLIVVAYRRFFQWLPSDMFQRYRMDKTKGETNWKNHWPTKDGPGENVTLLFPFYYKMYAQLGHRFVDQVLEAVGDTFPVRILNLHDANRQSLRSTFVCDILPNAPSSCDFSLQLDRQTDFESIMYHNDATGALHVNYDMMTTGAAQLGIIDMERFDRREIRTALRMFTEVELGKTPWDFKLICPEPDQLEDFLNISLELEAKVFGEELAGKMEMDTRAAYQTDAASKVFCEVDAKETVTNDPWKSFFARYASMK